MPTDNVALIASIEVIAVLLVICVFMLLRMRALLKMIRIQKEKIADLRKTLNSPKEEPDAENENRVAISWIEVIDHQIGFTRAYHDDHDAKQDIALDLSPESPLPLRVASLRNAILLAEKESFAELRDPFVAPKWGIIRERYKKIFEYLEPEIEQGATPEEVAALEKNLASAQKRIKNLEKFRKLYFQLEERWKASQEEAKEHADELTSMSEGTSSPDEFNSSIGKYQDSFKSVNDLFDSGFDAFIESLEKKDPLIAKNIVDLRAFAEEQQRIISQLKAQLDRADNDDVKTNIINGLQKDLDKQGRFIKESEMLIKQLEEELDKANDEMDAMRYQFKKVPELKKELESAINKREQLEMKLDLVITENNKLKVSSANNASDEATKLKNKLSTLETKYEELEEKYLDLKLQQ